MGEAANEGVKFLFYIVIVIVLFIIEFSKCYLVIYECVAHNQLS